MSEKKSTSKQSEPKNEGRPFSFPRLGVTVYAANRQEAEKMVKSKVDKETE